MNESNINQLYFDEVDSIFISLTKSSLNRMVLALVNRGEKRVTIVIPPPGKYGGERKEVRLIPGEPQEIVYENVRLNYCWKIIKLARNANPVNLCEINMSKIQAEVVEVDPLPEPIQTENQSPSDIDDMPLGIRLPEIQPLSSEAQAKESVTPEREIIEEELAVPNINQRERLPNTQGPEESAEAKPTPGQQMEQQSLKPDERTESISEETEEQEESAPATVGETWEQIQQIHQQAQSLVSEITDVRERVIDLYGEMEEICRSSSRLYKALQRANKRARQIVDELQHIRDDSQEDPAESTEILNNE